MTRCPVGTVPLPVPTLVLLSSLCLFLQYLVALSVVSFLSHPCAIKISSLVGVLPAPPRTAEQGLVQRPVQIAPLPVGAARLLEEASQRSDGPVGSAQLSAAIVPLLQAPPDAAVAPASSSQRALGVGEASPVASL